MIELDVAIVGGGFSGCAVAANLARHGNPDLSVTIFEPDSLGRGAAYGTSHREHLLNTRANQMSLYSGDADHFVRWLGVRGNRTDFVSRQLYGEYVGEIARHALERPRFTRVPDRVISVRRASADSFVLETSRARFGARAVVLATGNPTPNEDSLPPAARVHPGYILDPWRFDYRTVGGQVLVVGSGLTALDVLVALKASGHRGTVHVLSRHGRFPEVHANVDSYEVLPALDTSGARELLRSFRQHVGDAAKLGFDWRAIVDALRPESETIWRRLPYVEQRRFERHLRSYWERHRHRAPQQVDAVAREYLSSGRLHRYSGRVLGMEREVVTVELRGGATVELRPDWIVNCSGLGRLAAMARDPLLGKLLAEGTVSPDDRGLALRVDSDCAAIDTTGNRVEGVWIVGPPARGSRFEATSVPELRAMAEDSAAELLRAMRSTRPGGVAV